MPTSDPTPQAKQPVPDAGVREKIRTAQRELPELRNLSLTDQELDIILSLLPAPTPATSEDTRLLDWLEQQYVNIYVYAIKHGADAVPPAYCWCGPNIRRNPRAARANKGRKV